MRARAHVEAKLAPQDIDQVRVGQSAVLRFSAFNQGTTPELNGVVSRVSADLTTDRRTGAAYYVVRISLPESEIARLQGLRLVPGMPVETSSRPATEPSCRTSQSLSKTRGR
jgi:HlyD family secretion protein